MPKNQFLPAIAVASLLPLVAWAQVPGLPSLDSGNAATAAKPAEEPPTEAEKTLDEAVKKVAALKSVSADITQSVDMLEQKFQVAGRYLKAPNHRVYLRLAVSGLPDSSGTMLQVCDGQTLWDYQQILDAQIYRKVEVGQVFEKLNAPEIDADLRDQVTTQLGFAGPEQLLKGLRRAVRFEQREAGTLDGKPIWILRGNWRSREGLTAPNQQPLPETATLPPYIPSFVILSIGQEDGWPHKLTLVGKAPSGLLDTRPRGPDGQPLGTLSSLQSVKPTRMELSYTNVKLNPDLKLEEFVFQAPPGAKVDDGTTMIVNGLDLMIQNQISRKRAEAAKTDGPLLDQTIPVPKPGGAEVAPAPTPAIPTTPR
jgi:outer membrane lipoprotein-sorting protein